MSIKGRTINVVLGPSGRRTFLFRARFLNNHLYGINPADRSHYEVHVYFNLKHNAEFNILLVPAYDNIRVKCEVLLDYARG